MREASRATLATHAGLAPDALADALDRLIALDYVSRTGKIDQWMYRAVARVDGDSAEPAPPIRRT